MTITDYKRLLKELEDTKRQLFIAREQLTFQACSKNWSQSVWVSPNLRGVSQKDR